MVSDSRARTMPMQIRRQQPERICERSLLDKLAPARVVARESVQQNDRVTGDEWLRNRRAEFILCLLVQCR